ncbi:MAG: UDP-N-acetylglucosamine 1-carboxyvinyltransferase [Alphaproteobacteria bacterium]|nr:UDP-N-acetylglucosamine 1-carboxyvinyltransferase [Alphaproteobacteria bacterium]
MQAFKITGGKKLTGTIAVQGAKNAVLPLMAAALLTDEPVTLRNTPYLSDVHTLSDLLASLGAEITHGADSITVRAKNITNLCASYEFVSRMRASFWVLGPLLARFHEAKVSLPGGCAIGARPVDRYLKALQNMGASLDIAHGYVVARGKLHAAEHTFPSISVGASHNTIMAAVLTPGETILHNVAVEPEVVDLIHLLQKMGARIEGAGTPTLRIAGVKKLHGATHDVIPDRIETATFAVAAAMTQGHVFIQNGRLDLMHAVADTLTPSGVKLVQKKEGLDVDATRAAPVSVNVVTREYPAFPTDAQSLLSAFLCVADGTASIQENIFENRFMHIPELQRMGADIDVIDNHSVVIRGGKPLSGAVLTASDLRGGVGLVLAALVAEGQSVIQRIYHIDRGYYHLEEKLKALGADIERCRFPDGE